MFFSVDIEPIVHVNQSSRTPPSFAVCQILAVRPPPHQHGLSSSHNTPSVCSPVVPARQVLPSPSSACLWSLTTHVSVRLSPDFFQFRNVVPACYRSTKGLVFVHIRQDQILSPRVHFCFHARFVSALSAFSSAGLRRCRTVRRNTELQVDQKPLQHKTSVWPIFSLSVSHPITAAEQQSREQEWRKEATAEVGVKRGEESQQSLKPIQILALILCLQT